MPRRRPVRSYRSLSVVSSLTTQMEIGPDGQTYHTQPIAGYRTVKIYRCPGCDQLIQPGVAHMVVWPVEEGSARLEERRHWHRSCWSARHTRKPTRRWS